MVGGIAHGQHSVGEKRKMLRQEEVLQEGALNIRAPGQDALNARGKEAVAQPSGALTGGAVHVDVHRVGTEGFDSRVKDTVHGVILSGKARGDVCGGEGDMVQAQIAHGDRAPLGGQAQIPHDVRLRRGQAVPPGADADPDDIGGSHAEGIERAKGYDIEFSNVGFSYDTGDEVLKDVSFVAKQGEVTALIGPSGGGKTTISRLAARFWDADKGKITVGGMDISMIDPETLMSLYSIVFQDVTLFNNTVIENIRIGKMDATDEEVIAAAKLAHCDEFAEKLSDGWNTMIGENGCELSGGERQRISIARAFLKDAPVILLDEATASLDVDNETMIQESLSQLIKNKTVMIIAHRMRTVADADKIVVLKNGKVAESGKPSELMAKSGIYAGMVNTQLTAAKWSL